MIDNVGNFHSLHEFFDDELGKSTQDFPRDLQSKLVAKHVILIDGEIQSVRLLSGVPFYSRKYPAN